MVGVFDDVRHIPWLRLLIQYGAGIAGDMGRHRHSQRGATCWRWAISPVLLTVPLTALSVAGLSNAYNMIDGIDGLAAATIAPAAAGAVYPGTAGGTSHGRLPMLMLVPLAVFLLFNLGPDNRRCCRKIFLGDGAA